MMAPDKPARKQPKKGKTKNNREKQEKAGKKGKKMVHIASCQHHSSRYIHASRRSRKGGTRGEGQNLASFGTYARGVHAKLRSGPTEP